MLPAAAPPDMVPAELRTNTPPPPAGDEGAKGARITDGGLPPPPPPIWMGGLLMLNRLNEGPERRVGNRLGKLIRLMPLAVGASVSAQKLAEMENNNSTT